MKIGRLTALITFLLGTVIFGLYCLTSAFDLIFIGYVYILLAVVINLGVVFFILSKFYKDKVNRTELYKTCGLILLNIPVMIVYVWVTNELLNTMRITFTNSTSTTLTSINAIGCGGAHIDKLEIGENETVWIDITGDCSIEVEYLFNGQQKEESVAGYVTNNMGQKMTYNIGGQNE